MKQQQVVPSSSSAPRRSSAAPSLSKTLFWTVSGAIVLLQSRRVLQPGPQDGRRAVVSPKAQSSSAYSSLAATAHASGPLPSLRFDWSHLELHSPLAKIMESHQTDCSLPLGDLRMRNAAGLGSDLHLWTQALCNGMQEGVRVVTHGPWIFRDARACANTDSAEDDAPFAMLCYFPRSELRCPNDRLTATVTGAATTSDRVQLYVGNGKVPRKCLQVRHEHNITFSDVRAAGVEYLFSQTAPVVIKEARRQLKLLFGDTPPDPSSLITVHIRWGDKIQDMELRPINEYIEAVLRLANAKNLRGPEVHVFLASEDPLAVQGFLEAAKVHQWNVAVDAYFQEFQTFRDPSLNGNPHMAQNLDGRPGLVALASVLVSLQANDYVLTTRSNWSRLLNELRKNVVDPRCGSCTKMIDLSPNEFEW